MKIVGTILLAVSILGMASGQSARFQADPIDPQDYHLHQALKFMCTLMESMDSLNFISVYLEEFKMTLQPVCKYILKEADAPGGFKATKFCHFLVEFLQFRTLMHSTVKDIGPESLWNDFSVRLYANVTKNLYGIDINDPTTICPNAHRYFQHSIRDLITNHQIEYFIELLNNFNHEIDFICRDLKGYFASLGVPRSSPFLQLLGNILDLSTDVLGFQNFGNLCQMMRSREYFSGDLSLQREAAKSVMMEYLAYSNRRDKQSRRRTSSNRDEF